MAHCLGEWKDDYREPVLPDSWVLVLAKPPACCLVLESRLMLFHYKARMMI